MIDRSKPILQVAFENAITAACKPQTAGGILLAAMQKHTGESFWEDVVFFLMREKPL